MGTYEGYVWGRTRGTFGDQRGVLLGTYEEYFWGPTRGTFGDLQGVLLGTYEGYFWGRTRCTFGDLRGVLLGTYEGYFWGRTRGNFGGVRGVLFFVTNTRKTRAGFELVMQLNFVFLSKLNEHNILNTYIYPPLASTCSDVCYAIFRETNTSFAQELYAFCSVVT